MNNFKLSRKLIFDKINVNKVNSKVTEVTNKNQSPCFLATLRLIKIRLVLMVHPFGGPS